MIPKQQQITCGQHILGYIYRAEAIVDQLSLTEHNLVVYLRLSLEINAAAIPSCLLFISLLPVCRSSLRESHLHNEPQLALDSLAWPSQGYPRPKVLVRHQTVEQVTLSS